MDDHAKLMAALNAEPRPITGERIKAIAEQVLDGPTYRQFAEWLKPNGLYLLEQLNGG
jgi:hypothetical protein